MGGQPVPQPPAARARRRILWRAVGWAALLALVPPASRVAASVAEREPVTMSVVVVNPSTEKTQTVPVRIDLPQEITPTDVLEKGELTLEFDDGLGLYYVYKAEVELKPKETHVFEVTLRDKWFIPQEQLDSLSSYAQLLLGKLKGSDYYDSASQLTATITAQLKEIEAIQTDESLSRKSRIGAYRINLQTLEKIKEDLARVEKLLTFTGGPPVPEMLEESPLKSDAPSSTTTWLVIFLIMVFIGLLGGQFFFTWHRRTQAAQDLSVVRHAAFAGPRLGPGQGSGLPRPDAKGAGEAPNRSNGGGPARPLAGGAGGGPGGGPAR